MKIIGCDFHPSVTQAYAYCVIALVEADDVGLAFGGLGKACDLFGGAVGFSIGTNAHPVAGGALKVDDVGAGILALQAIAQFFRGALAMESADLDAPAALLRCSGREAQHVDADARGSGAPDADFDGGGTGQIENAARDKRPAIRDGDNDRPPSVQIGDAHDGTHGQSAMRGRHGVLVVDLAVGAAGVMVGSAVPTGDADLAGSGF